MPKQYHHGIFPSFSHDEHALQEFVLCMREYVAGGMVGGNEVLWENSAEPAFVKKHGRPPANRVEGRALLEAQPFHQAWSSLNVNTQEMIWSSVQDGVDRQADDLNERALVTKPKGSLRTNPDMEVPRYAVGIDIHRMPGGYGMEYEPDDVYQGAVYDRGAFMYGRGHGGPLHDGATRDLKAYIDARHPGFAPAAVLDMGCGMGNSSVAAAKAFPNAKVHAIDVSAPLVRYGHARAESLGVGVHFSQQNAEQTDYPDESFDLIFSCIMLHETSTKALPNYLRETWRLLKPGGIALHMDFANNSGKSVFEQSLAWWSTHHNGEPFVGKLSDIDVAGEAVKAGFPHNAASFEKLSHWVPTSYLSVLDARKPV